jgi:hypothetical protein
MRHNRRIAMAVTAVALFVTLTATRAQASTILNLQGTASGCFDCTPSALASSDTVGGLTFTGGSFNATTDATGAALPTLGFFDLSLDAFNYSNNHVDFLLGVTFTAPTGLDAANGSFTAQIEGSINTNKKGNVNVLFDSAPQTFTFANATGSGSFQFAVDNPILHLQPGGDTHLALLGEILNAQFTPVVVHNDPPPGDGTGGDGSNVPVPEPASLVLMGAGVVCALRRRRA